MKTSFEEEVYLRVLTGRLVGKVLNDVGVNKVAVVVPKNHICISMGSATLSGFLAHSGNVGRIFVIEKPEDIDRVVEYDPQLVVFQFGGETPPEETKRLFRGVIERLSDTDAGFDVVIHVRTYAMGAYKETSDMPFWKDRDIYVYTVDLDRGKVFLNKVEGEDLEKIFEYDVTFEHADLLNRSLKDRTVTFQ